MRRPRRRNCPLPNDRLRDRTWRPLRHSALFHLTAAIIRFSRTRAMAVRMQILFQPAVLTGGVGMNKVKQDIRYALRQLYRSKAFAAVAILTLALGIGANTAIFSVIDSILLEPLPFPHQDRLMQLAAGTDYYNYPKGWIREYQRRAHTFAGISGYSQNVEYNVTGGGTTGRAFGSTVDANLFDTLGVRPAMGRFFSPTEETDGQDRVIVLSNGFWKEQFGGDPSIVGRTMMLDGMNREIIGVAPAQVRLPDFETQFWIPIAFKTGNPFDPWAPMDY